MFLLAIRAASLRSGLSCARSFRPYDALLHFTWSADSVRAYEIKIIYDSSGVSRISLDDDTIDRSADHSVEYLNL
eukprot:2741104-Heterocapsa_arctica.AAC.1